MRTRGGGAERLVADIAVQRLPELRRDLRVGERCGSREIEHLVPAIDLAREHARGHRRDVAHVDHGDGCGIARFCIPCALESHTRGP